MDSDLTKNNETESSASKLLEQYDNHIQEKEKDLDYIEKGDRRFTKDDGGPSYDDLYKDNVKLRLKVEEYEAEIEALKGLVEKLKELTKSNVNLVQQKMEIETPKETTLPLPPRSADRMRNIKNLSIDAADSEHLNLPRSPGTFQLNKDDLKEELKANAQLERGLSNAQIIESSSKEDNNGLPDVSREQQPNSPLSNAILGSPATSVTYTTSRISINSTNSPSVSAKSQLKKPTSPTGQRNTMRSPQRSNRVTHLINNEIHSPLKEQFYNTDQDFNEDTISNPIDDFLPNLSHTSPIIDQKPIEDDDELDFSPSSKQNLNKFTEMINKTFGDSDKDENIPKVPIRPPNFDNLSHDASSNTLASPVLIQNNANGPLLSLQNSSRKTNISSNELLRNASQDNTPVISSNASIQVPYSPRSVSSTSRVPPPNDQFYQTSVGPDTNDSIHKGNTSMPSLVSDIPLFVQPEEFPTISVEIASTLYSNVEDPFKCILFSVIDKKSTKEMFQFAKSMDQILDLDHLLKIRLMEQYHLPELPKKQLFQVTIPVKVDLRRELINNYFIELFKVKNLAPVLSLKIAQFISTDTVINMPMSDIGQEGTVLVRKSKTLGSGNTWKVRHAVIEDNLFLLYDKTHLVDTIKMTNSTIELQANLPDDKYGTKNGFIINEQKKSGLSTTTKHFLSTETSKQREEWVSSLMKVCGMSASNVRMETFSSMHDQGSLSDTSMETNHSSAIGPMVNLEALNKSHIDEPIVTELDKETKRNRMRSFFPFKKNQTILSNAALDLGKESDEFPEKSFARTLRSMNLSEEPVNNVVFGSDIKSCLSLSSNSYQNTYEVPSVVYRCLEYLYKNRALSEEGIFRLSGSSSLIKSLQEQFDKEYDVNLCEYNRLNEDTKGPYLDVNTVTGLLKLYFRKLPHLIFGDEMYDEFKNIAESNSNDPTRIALEFREVITGGKIQPANYSLMYVLFELLVKINENNKVNKMNLRNLCIVFSPTLNIPVNILRPFIEDFQCVFVGKDPLQLEERQNIDIQIPQM